MTALTKTCDHCGQIIPPELRFRGPVTQHIYDVIAKHPEGIPCNRVADIVYADDRGGGPEYANTAIHVLISKMRPTLAAHGLAIVSTLGRGAAYRLVPYPREIR